MIRRELIEVLKGDLKEVPTIVLFGPQQAGKTTLLKGIGLGSIPGHVAYVISAVSISTPPGHHNHTQPFPGPAWRRPARNPRHYEDERALRRPRRVSSAIHRSCPE